jgi:predicted dehydrogenase
MIRVGLVDFDTSHVVAFTQRLNHVGVGEDQWVNGAKVVAGCPGTSEISPERIPGYIEQLKGYGVEIVNNPEDLIGKIDAVCIESQGGSVHLERAKPFIEAKLPVYVDKPFTCSTEEAKTLFELANKNNVPVFSSSSLRYALEIREVKAQADALGKVVGADAYSPASLHPGNPGLFHYGIHGVETLFALMGKGCQSVQCAETEGTTQVTGLWADGRIGTVRGTRQGAHSYGFAVFCEKQVIVKPINATYIYRELLREIVKMFETGKPSIDPQETVEIVAFIEAAMESANNHGGRITLKTS